VWLWIFEMCLIDWVVFGNDDYSLVGCLVGFVCCFGGGCEAVLVRKRPRDCG